MERRGGGVLQVAAFSGGGWASPGPHLGAADHGIPLLSHGMTKRRQPMKRPRQQQQRTVNSGTVNITDDNNKKRPRQQQDCQQHYRRQHETTTTTTTTGLSTAGLSTTTLPTTTTSGDDDNKTGVTSECARVEGRASPTRLFVCKSRVELS